MSIKDVRKNFEVLVITHADLDGAGCAVVIKAAYRGKKKVFIQQAQDYPIADKMVREALEEKHWDRIFITDISVSEETAQYIDKYEKSRVTLIDHHPGREFLKQYTWCYIEESDKNDPLTPSGTSLVYDYFDECRTPFLSTFVELIRQYDTWAWKNHFDNEEPNTLNNYLSLVGFKDFIDIMLERIYDDDILTDGDRHMLYYKEKEIEGNIKSRSKRVLIKEIDGMRVGFVFAEKNLSELGNYIMEERDDLDCIIMYNLARGTVSIRSAVKDGRYINCTNLAKKWFNGGGHPLAGGGQISEEKMKKIQDILFDKPVDEVENFIEIEGE